MPKIADHPLRYALVNELHARPFPSLSVPSTAVFMAIKEPKGAHNRDRSADWDHLLRLLDRFGSAHPQPGATHFSTEIGRSSLKWESHTEFVTYTTFTPGVSDRPFDPSEAQVFPEDWLAKAPGTRLASVLMRIEEMPESIDEVLERVDGWFVAESLAVSSVLDGAAIIAGDFRIDAAGHMRFAVFVRPGVGERRIGRIVQRLCEIEIYRAMSMLGLARARDMSPSMNDLDQRLNALVSGVDAGTRSPEVLLDELLSISAELEALAVRFSFRAGATGAYEVIVNQRIQILREERIEGRQTFAEFMMRRFDPAMRTVKSADDRLHDMAQRAARAAELLRTRVDVERSAHNQALLASMDRRSDLQLRLQNTVEGLSVVAISYYAVSLASYGLYPLAKSWDVSKEILTALLVLPVMVCVWAMIRQIKKSVH